MPALANIVINDAEVSPVAHTFAPVSVTGKVAKFANRSATIPEGFELLIIEVSPPARAGGAHTVRVGLGDPTEVTVSGVTSVDHVNSLEFKLNLSSKSTAQERKNLLKLGANLCINADFVKVVENIENYY